MTTIQSFMKRHYKHFNAAVCVDAAEGWIAHLNEGRKNAHHSCRSDEYSRTWDFSG